MPRPPRAEVEGGLHHVTARGVARQAVFHDDTDRERYIRILSGVSRFLSWRCLSYCFMDNHIHLLVETPLPNLGRGIQRLHGEYARTFNRRHKRVGHLYQDRFKGVLVRDEAHLWNVIRYIANNPVEAGMCDSAERWPWSSHAAIVTGTSPTWLDERRLFALVGADGGDPRTVYANLVKGSDPLC
jgi:REP-associated tyrosine transposase